MASAVQTADTAQAAHITIVEQKKFIIDFVRNNQYTPCKVEDKLIPYVYNMYKNDDIDILKYKDILSSDQYSFLFSQCGTYLDIKKEYKKAHQHHLQSAKSGNSYGMVGMDTHYYYGYEVEIDYKIAFEYYKKSADLDNPYGFLYWKLFLQW